MMGLNTLCSICVLTIGTLVKNDRQICCNLGHLTMYVTVICVMKQDKCTAVSYQALLVSPAIYHNNAR